MTRSGRCAHLRADARDINYAVRGRYQANDEALGVLVKKDFTRKLTGDNAAHEISAEALVSQCFGQLGAASFLPFQLELAIWHR